MSTDKERMEMLLAHLKMNANELATSLGYKRTEKVYHVLRERNGISNALARDICSTYPNISYNWIKSDEGEMIVNEPETEPAPTSEELNELEQKFIKLVEDYHDMKEQRDFWRERAQDLEYKLAKIKVG